MEAEVGFQSPSKVWGLGFWAAPGAQCTSYLGKNQVLFGQSTRSDLFKKAIP